MTTVTFDDAVVAMSAVLDAGFTVYPIIYENPDNTTGNPPEPPAPWVRAEFRHVGGDQMSIGSPGDNFHEDMGALIVAVHVPAGKGDALCRQICDQIVALFRGRTFSSVEITHIGGDDGGSAVEDNGNWWRRWRRIEFLYRLTA